MTRSLVNRRIVSMIRELSRPDDRINIAGLAEKFEVSERTVRNDLNAINDILKKHKQDAVRLEKGGWIIRGNSFPDVLTYIDNKDFYEYKLSKEERKEIAAVLLISSSGFITLSRIADYMAVSRATIINDLDEIKKYIKKGNLEVHSHPNKGLRIEGTESNKRIFLMRLINDNPEMADEETVRKQIAVEEGTGRVLDRILQEQEHVHESFLNDSSFQKIVIYLGIMAKRIRQGEYIEAGEKRQNGKYTMARDVMKYVGQYCHINVTEDEIQFLSRLLVSARYMKQKNYEKDSVKIQMVARTFIEAISEELGIDLNKDYDFFENLSNHLESSLSAAHINYEQNPVIENVAEENPEVRRAVRKKSSIIQQHAGRELTEVEIEYITVHVCAAIERKKNNEIAFRVIVACHAGVGTSYLLQEKLKRHFNFQIIDIVSSHEAGSLREGQADFVISTVPLKECGIEYITVSPLLKDEDYIRIGNMVDRLRESRHLPLREKENQRTAKELMKRIAPLIHDRVPNEAQELLWQIGMIVTDYFGEPSEPDEEIYAPCLYQLLPPSHIRLDVICADWQEAVRESARELLVSGYIEERYVDAMIRNIEENGPYIVLSKGFALPHEGIDKGTKKLGMSFIRLKQPVEFDTEGQEPVEFVCCLSAVDHKTHLKAFFHLVNMLKKEEFKEELRSCRKPEEITEIIKKYENRAEEE